MERHEHIVYGTNIMQTNRSSSITACAFKIWCGKNALACKIQQEGLYTTSSHKANLNPVFTFTCESLIAAILYFANCQHFPLSSWFPQHKWLQRYSRVGIFHIIIIVILTKTCTILQTESSHDFYNSVSHVGWYYCISRNSALNH